MEKSESSEKGVIFASFLLVLMAAPFFLVTSSMIIVLLFSPLVLVLSYSPSDLNLGYENYARYMVFISVMVLSFLVSYALIAFSIIIKVNCLTTKDRKSPKSYLYDFIGFLLGLIGIVLLVGAVLGFTAAGFLGIMMDSRYWHSENIKFLIFISLSGVLSIISKKFLLRAEWWRK